MRKWLTVALKVCVTVAILALVARDVDWPAVGGILGRMSVAAAIIAVVLITLQNALAILRWWVILRATGIDIPVRDVARYMMTGLFLNQPLPSTVGGDAVRIWLLHRRNVPISEAVRGILLDRVLALVGLLLLILATQPFFVAITGEWVSAGVFAGLLLVLLGGLFAGAAFGERIARLPLNRVASSLVDVLITTRTFVQSPRRTVWPLVLTIAAFIIMATVVFALGRGLGVGVTYWQYLVLCPPVFLLSALPISIAGWGVREGAMVVVLGYVSVPLDEAFALSVALGLTVLVGSLPGGLFLIQGGFAKDFDTYESDDPPPGHVSSRRN